MLTQYYAKVWDRLRYKAHKLRHGKGALGYFQFMGRQFDRKYGVETTTGVPMEVFKTESANRGLANSYAPASPLALMSLRKVAGMEPGRFTFVDLGCGKGRVLILAAEAGFKKVVGVEFCADLTAQARENMAAYQRKFGGRQALEVIQLDATEYVFPETPAVIFFYNAFRGEVLGRVLENLGRSVAAVPRETYFIWYAPHFYPEMEAVFEANGGLKPVVRDPQFTIYTY